MEMGGISCVVQRMIAMKYDIASINHTTVKAIAAEKKQISEIFRKTTSFSSQADDLMKGAYNKCYEICLLTLDQNILKYSVVASTPVLLRIIDCHH